MVQVNFYFVLTGKQKRKRNRIRVPINTYFLPIHYFYPNIPQIEMRVLILSFLSLTFVSCETTNHKEELLAKQYCGGCHAFPEPSLLDKTTWAEKVLPQMAFRMGYSNSEIMANLTPDDLPIVLGTIPNKPMVTPQEWESIVNYFIRNSPDSLTIVARPVTAKIEQFNVKPSLAFHKYIVTLIKYDTLHHKLYVGNRASKLYTLDTAFTARDSIQLPSPPSHIVFGDAEQFVSVMGIMDPNDQPRGALLQVQLNAKTSLPILGSLKRPVYFEKTDLNGDGRDELIICSFGNYTGALQLFEARENKSYVEHKLNAMPGARKVVCLDFDHDGMKDILVLMTQGDERLVLYANKGNLQFEEKNLLRFPPVNGSNYFEMVDFNKDGHLDILYVNGDNGDYSAIFKPYHGIKIYLNDGLNNFKLSWSTYMQGASQAVARDFDQDGDLDIAAIAFFADFQKHPEQSFLYFENQGNDQFVAQSTELAALGRWLVMEAADFDQDGDTDVVLGAANFGGLGANSANTKWRRSPGTLLIFQNKLTMKSKK